MGKFVLMLGYMYVCLKVIGIVFYVGGLIVVGLVNVLIGNMFVVR